MLLDRNGVDESQGRVDTVRIKVVGVGGGGVNALRRMAEAEIPGVELLCVNTDVCSLRAVRRVPTITLGEQTTKGLGAGGNPRVGRRAAEEAQEQLRSFLEGADLVFIAAGMGGGTGTGGAPVVADLARDLGALTVAVVTTPFGFEGSRRRATAIAGLRPLRDAIDTLIVVSNDRLISAVNRNTSVHEAFTMADQVMVQAILGVSRIINIPGEVNVDFADIKATIGKGGLGLMGIGHTDGDRRVLKAAQAALANPLLDISAQGARGMLFVVNGGADVTLGEVTEAGSYLADVVHPEAQIFFGLHTDPRRRPEAEVEVILIATHLPPQRGYDDSPEPESIQRLRATIPIYEADADLPPFLREGWLANGDPSGEPSAGFFEGNGYGPSSAS